ncbi:MAG: FAD-dependent oxidoreductase [Aureispira sp.]
MNRRDFLKYGALTLSPIVLKVAHDASQATPTSSFEIEILSDAAVGHILRESQQYPKGVTKQTDYLIVGGGIAGLSAAYELRDQDFLLCELSERLGGSSSANTHRDQYFAQGAHYDLAYPAYYGKDLLKVLFDLDIIDYNRTLETWQFVDRQYLIPAAQESITFDAGVFRKDVLPEGESRAELKALLLPFVGKMLMPTPEIAAEFHYLNNITFAAYLAENNITDPALLKAIDYAMRDDWGAPSTVVSALAGVHYYTCRPYFEQEPELLSPPQGNAYFAQRFISRMPQERLLTQQLVQKIVKNEEGFEVTIVNVKAKEQWTVQTKKIVYAAHKHALKFIYPTAYTLFQENKYSPWVTINVVLKTPPPTKKMYWQNEYLSGATSFMGFVDSAAQFQPRTTRRTLTAYYCLTPEERNTLLAISEQAPALVEQTIGYLEEVLKEALRPQIEKVYIKVMGHAMPIPTPHFLLKDPNINALETGIAYAGVDVGRLPLFFEAADSGLQAARALQEGHL